MEGKLETEMFSYGVSNRSRLKKPVIINCNIGDTLTPTFCTKIVTEIAKYIFCNKLIPYPYDALRNVAQNLHRWSVEKHVQSQRRRAVQIKRHHKKVVEAYENFENISQNIRLELENSVACDDVVEEVVLLIGATSWSPREVYRILVPPISSAEPDQKINDSKILLKLIECIVLSEDIEGMLSQSISPTNMYVMLRKKQGRQSGWFVPKDSYNLPLCGRQAIIVLGGQVQQLDGDTTDCNAPVGTGTKVQAQQEPLLELIDNLHIVPKCTQWFQSRVSLKGFRHCKNSRLS